MIDRVTPLNRQPIAAGRAVLYWMQRSQRSRSNPALNEAIEQANELRVPVVCYLGLDDSYPRTMLRDYRFVLEGLRDVAEGLRDRGVGFVVRRESTVRGITRLAGEVQAALVVTDESHLRLGRQRRQEAASRLDHAGIPLWSVDADVLVPVRAIGGEQYAARTIRPRLLRLRDQFLHPLPHPTAMSLPPEVASDVHLEHIEGTLNQLQVERTLSHSVGYVGGERAARTMMERFVTELLLRYHADRNNAALDVTSNLSPYFHFGQLDPWTVALTISQADVPAEAKDSYLEELLIRRELASNFTFYNPHYDTLAALPAWARDTLEEHTQDPREHLYTLVELAEARTGDDLWNASQLELLLTGSMHGWIRMYWGKRIMQWAATPAEALASTLHLNNLYALDGRDPVSFANILWCYGKHDRPWPQRPIFGTVRSMTRAGAERKFDVAAYIARVAELAERNPDVVRALNLQPAAATLHQKRLAI